MKVVNALGRRKSAVARVYVVAGKGNIAINGREIENYFREVPLKPYTPKSIRTHHALVEELERTRVRGFSIDDEEHEEKVFCIGVPVRDYTGHIIAAMSVSWPVFRFNQDSFQGIAKKIVDTAEALSKVLGYIPN